MFNRMFRLIRSQQKWRFLSQIDTGLSDADIHFVSLMLLDESRALAFAVQGDGYDLWDASVYRSINGGAGWQSQVPLGKGTFEDVCAVANTVYLLRCRDKAQREPFMQVSNDGGATWETRDLSWPDSVVSVEGLGFFQPKKGFIWGRETDGLPFPEWERPFLTYSDNGGITNDRIDLPEGVTLFGNCAVHPDGSFLFVQGTWLVQLTRAADGRWDSRRHYMPTARGPVPYVDAQNGVIWIINGIDASDESGPVLYRMDSTGRFEKIRSFRAHTGQRIWSSGAIVNVDSVFRDAGGNDKPTASLPPLRELIRSEDGGLTWQVDRRRFGPSDLFAFLEERFWVLGQDGRLYQRK